MEYPKPVLVIGSLKDGYSFFEEFVRKGNEFIYRGVQSEAYFLTPSVGRIMGPDGNPLKVADEKRLLSSFRKRAYPFIKEHGQDDLTLLTIGQHHGLPTRLLDWTANPLMALYFAVEFDFSKEDKTKYSCLYILDIKHNKIQLQEQLKPFEISEVKRFIPYHWDTRITAQEGHFTIHNEPNEPWSGDGNLQRVFIHRSVRKDIKGLLDKFGVNASTVYPDLDGIAQYVKWLKSNGH